MRAHRVFLSLASLGIILLAAGCSGSSKSTRTPSAADATRATAVASEVPGGTATPVPPAGQTAVAAGGQVAMVPYTDPKGRYSTVLPEGWAVEQGADTITAVLPGDPVDATLVIACQPGISAQQFVQRDNQVATRFGAGKVDPLQATPTTVAGQQASIIPWEGKLGGVDLQHVNVYFEGAGCGWRIGLTTYPGTLLGDMRPVLDKVSAAFKFS